MEPDKYQYKGWMQSDYMIKRAVSVVGHYCLGALFFYTVLIVCYLTILFLLYMAV